jgi:hypothetical protein
MTTRARRAATPMAVALTTATLLSACGTAAPAARTPAAEVKGGGAPFLATSLTTPAATWAVVVMGGSAASHNNFWQLFVRLAGSGSWRLVTPPGVPDNGGLVVAAESGQSVITAFRPSQYLTFTPLTHTADAGHAWSSLNPVDAALANVPDALAVAPSNGRVLALLADGTVKAAAPGAAAWHTLVTKHQLARTPAGQRCGLSGLTAASLTPGGVPIIGASCADPGVVGILALSGGTWHAAGPALPATLARQRISVLRLTRAGRTTAALIAAGTGRATRIFAAWSTDDGVHWALSPQLRLHGAAVTSASFRSGSAAVVVAGRRGAVITDGQTWKALPSLPPGTATIAQGPTGTFQALAVHRSTLTVWQASALSAAWRMTQTISVPIQYGSSG